MGEHLALRQRAQEVGVSKRYFPHSEKSQGGPR